MDNFFLIPGLSQLMNGFRTVNAVDVLLFLLCLIGVAFFAKYVSNYGKNHRTLCFPYPYLLECCVDNRPL